MSPAVASRWLIVLCVLTFACTGPSTCPAIAREKSPRPTLLLAISDDQSYPYSGAYGATGVKTPAFDRIAESGVLFRNGFAASPGCSPSRAALLTGRNTWEIEQAGTHASSFPAKFAVYPDILEKAGYHVGYTGKGWGPGNFKAGGRDRNPAGNPWQLRKMESPQGISNRDYAGNFADFLKARPAGAPFCFWYGASEPHRSYKKGIGLEQGKKLEEAQVPGFLPDTPEIRSDILDYCVEIEWFDQHLMRIIRQLEEAGELDNTLIIVTGDNGMPFPRAKANCYEYGIHVPFAASWPARAPQGRRVDDLVGFVDIAPTFLEAAGVEIPEEMSGRSLMPVLLSEKSGQVDPQRTQVYAARERHSSSRYNNWTYPIRALRTPDYLYVRNFRPQRWPAGDPAGFKGDRFGYYDIDACPTKTFLWEHRDDEELAKYFQWSVEKRPAEELFDIRTDAANLHNLADDPEHRKTLEKLRRQMEEYLTKTGDPRMLDGGDIYEQYKRYSHIRTFPAPE